MQPTMGASEDVGASVAGGARGAALGRPQPFNRVEAAYTEMARDAGVLATRISVLEQDGLAHLLVHRLDLDGEQRRHQHTLGGLQHIDYNDTGASSYEEYLRTVLGLGLPHADVEQACVRMLFNLVAVNQDDHVKNLSFHMDASGAWSLSPAYDLTFARGPGFTARHQMRVRDRTEGITAEDLLAVCAEFGVDDPGALLQRVRDSVARFEEFAAATGVPADTRTAVRKALDLRAAELGAA